jgi:hypothetical protein
MMESQKPYTNDKHSKNKIFIIIGIVLCAIFLFGAGSILGQNTANLDADQRAADKIAEREDAEVYRYALQLDNNFYDITNEVINLGTLFQSFDGSAAWYDLAGRELAYIKDLSNEAYDLTPPSSVLSIHNRYMKGIGQMQETIALLNSAIYTSDSNLADAAYASFISALTKMEDASDQLKEITAEGTDL